MRRARRARPRGAGQASGKRSGEPFPALYGISDGTFCNWTARFGGMTVSEAKRLKTLDNENAKLMTPLAAQMLSQAAMKEPVSKKSRRLP
ncbi:hypothetical protein BYZ73_13605 [Rhodovulum viride]|uniref:Transposase n=1 Tax=Rhodovulum viride TaxID=1231134 RepID=A0ABX9DEM1_9RHOB|nr:hypothetical protein BYZ73_13605 [Rhodovulum viride]